MASGGWAPASIRVRTTLAAVGVVAIALLLGSGALAWLMAQSLLDGLHNTADQQISSLKRDLPLETDTSKGHKHEDVDELVWQVIDPSGQVVAASQALAITLPTDDVSRLRIPGSDHPYLVTSDEAKHLGVDYTIAVAISREPVSDVLAALVTPLAVGVPLLLLVVAGTTWLVVTRALAPVEEIRREVAQISDEQLDRRVPQPTTNDELSRLASTMNQMLERLDRSRQRQQQFVADASHELRSPLASIRQYAEVARAHPDAVPRDELVEAVYEESTRMQELVRQLLLLARLDDRSSARESVEVDLDDLALAAANKARSRGITVDTSGIRPARVTGDPVALRQVVDNLVDNACRFARGQVAISLIEEGDQITLGVDDDGPGIPEEDREKIFERFVRLDSARSREVGGTGLGLAIVKEIVAHHQGRVSVESSLLGGARLVVVLPT